MDNLDALELNAQAIMERLAGRVGTLELELAIARETIAELSRRLAGEDPGAE